MLAWTFRDLPAVLATLESEVKCGRRRTRRRCGPSNASFDRATCPLTGTTFEKCVAFPHSSSRPHFSSLHLAARRSLRPSQRLRQRAPRSIRVTLRGRRPKMGSSSWRSLRLMRTRTWRARRGSQVRLRSRCRRRTRGPRRPKGRFTQRRTEGELQSRAR